MSKATVTPSAQNTPGGIQRRVMTMRQFRKTMTAALVGVGALVLLSNSGFAHGGNSTGTESAPVQPPYMGQDHGGVRGGQPCPTGTMHQDMMGPGTMGPGMGGPGMGGSGMGGPGMMGPGNDGTGMDILCTWTLLS